MSFLDSVLSPLHSIAVRYDEGSFGRDSTITDPLMKGLASHCADQGLSRSETAVVLVEDSAGTAVGISVEYSGPNSVTSE